MFILLYKDNKQVFFYKRVLWQYLVDNYGLNCPQSTFRHYICHNEKFNNYFTSIVKTHISFSKHIVRFETQPGEQAQLDWKESINFTLNNGETIEINILVLLLPISKADSNLFFQLIDRRYEKFSTIITTNINFSQWDEVFGDAMIANAIMDRLLHHANIVTIKGKSFRLAHLLNDDTNS